MEVDLLFEKSKSIFLLIHVVPQGIPPLRVAVFVAEIVDIRMVRF
jgi:hypothetical protein